MNKKRKKSPISFGSEKCRRLNTLISLKDEINYITIKMLGSDLRSKEDYINIHAIVSEVLNHYIQLIDNQFDPIKHDVRKYFQELVNKTDLPFDIIQTIFDYDEMYLVEIGLLTPIEIIKEK